MLCLIDRALDGSVGQLPEIGNELVQHLRVEHRTLNVLGAGILAAQHRWDVSQTSKMLESEDPACFHFEGDTFRWDKWAVSAAQIETHRKLVTSFGSCSFNEPREDLRQLGLL